MRSDVVIRPYEDEDLSDVLSLLRRCLGEGPFQPRTPEWFRWKHFRGPFGRSILFVAETAGRVVGLRAFLMWDLITPDGLALKCGRPVDTATDAEFQRMGIFRRLTVRAMEHAQERGVDLLFNTPNPRSGAGYESMGWRQVGGVGVMVRPKLHFLRRGAPPDSIRQLITSDEPQFEDVPVRKPLGLRTPRTSEYLKWRFASHPHAHYSLVDEGRGGVVVRRSVRNGRPEIVVSDLYGGAAGAIRSLSSQVRVSYLVGWFSRGSPERREAIKGGLIPVPGVRALTLMARPLRELPVDVWDFSNWDLALSDLELL